MLQREKILFFCYILYFTLFFFILRSPKKALYKGDFKQVCNKWSMLSNKWLVTLQQKVGNEQQIVGHEQQNGGWSFSYVRTGTDKGPQVV